MLVHIRRPSILQGIHARSYKTTKSFARHTGWERRAECLAMVIWSSCHALEACDSSMVRMDLEQIRLQEGTLQFAMAMCTALHFHSVHPPLKSHCRDSTTAADALQRPLPGNDSGSRDPYGYCDGLEGSIVGIR